MVPFARRVVEDAADRTNAEIARTMSENNMCVSTKRYDTNTQTTMNVTNEIHGNGDGDLGSGGSSCESNMYALGLSFGASCLLLLLEQWLGSSSCDSSSISQLLWHTISKLNGKGDTPAGAQDVPPPPPHVEHL